MERHDERAIEPEASRRPSADKRQADSEKKVYLRAVYPLNDGIPHYVDVPGGW